jgi:hypothetical protein
VLSPIEGPRLLDSLSIATPTSKRGHLSQDLGLAFDDAEVPFVVLASKQ